jgi:hypothetical protein
MGVDHGAFASTARVSITISNFFGELLKHWPLARFQAGARPSLSHRRLYSGCYLADDEKRYAKISAPYESNRRF